MKIKQRLAISLLSIMIVLSISGCSVYKSKDDNEGVSEKPSLSPTRLVSLTTQSEFKNLISLELEKEGFEIVTQDKSKFQIEAIVGNEIDWCQGKKSRKIDNVIYKLKDIDSQKSIFILENEGWTTQCSFYQTSVFKKLAKMLSERWESPKSSWFYSDYIYF
ncbi:MAG: hypothetical protein D6B28_00105 [Gammaproteobacteria bacterium]|nr:MAG: hypothetical protein D6B28_00105 [Gammaproteobacteria bacterium]